MRFSSTLSALALTVSMLAANPSFARAPVVLETVALEVMSAPKSAGAAVRILSSHASFKPAIGRALKLGRGGVPAEFTPEQIEKVVATVSKSNTGEDAALSAALKALMSSLARDSSDENVANLLATPFPTFVQIGNPKLAAGQASVVAALQNVDAKNIAPAVSQQMQRDIMQLRAALNASMKALSISAPHRAEFQNAFTHTELMNAFLGPNAIGCLSKFETQPGVLAAVEAISAVSDSARAGLGLAATRPLAMKRMTDALQGFHPGTALAGLKDKVCRTFQSPECMNFNLGDQCPAYN